LLKGGLGGRGNASYKSSTNRAPRQHQTGEAGEEMWVWLRLKLLADVGLLGLPNAGKSTFLNSVSNAAAKVGDYPFTTLRPQLGVVRHKGREFVLADFTEEGKQVHFLKGGDGGRGNASYKTSTNRAPRQHGTGWPGEEMWVWLRLKLLADVGLVGLPNAGKSTFINAVTNAQAKVGAYAFTTLRPQLGVVSHKGREFVVADIPGLIEGAAEGAGIGDRFLGHIERCQVLLHLVDANDEDVATSYRVVRDELEAYGEGLAAKPAILALNKVDTLDQELIDALSAELAEASGAKVFSLSAAGGTGLDPVLDALVERLHRQKVEDEGPADQIEWSPL
jgi:GTP-binding protein